MYPHVCIAALALLFAAIAAQAQPAVTVRVESTAVHVNEPFALRISASGERVGRPVIPHVEGLVINRTPAGTSQSMQIQFVNGQAATNQVYEWTYYATAKREGELVIPPVSVKIDGQDVQSQEIRLTASAAPAPQAIPQPQAPSPRGQGRPYQSVTQPQQPSGEPTWDDTVLVECTVDKRRVYQGEPIALALSIWELQLWGLSIRYTGPRNLSMPSSEGFYATTPQRAERLAQRKGFDYQVEEYTQRLYPMRSGQLQIGAWVWEGLASAITQMGPRSHEFQLSTSPITIDVQPLPEAPAGFNGAVGRFRIQAQMQNQGIEQGVPADLTLRIDGDGNPDAIGAPDLPALEWAHVSGPSTDVQGVDQAGVSFVKNFRYSLTPLQAGDFAIPPVPFCYFDPAAKKYVTEETRVLNVSVQPGQVPTIGPSPEQPAPAPVTAPEDNIRTIHVGKERLRARPGSAAATLVLLAPPFFYGGFFLFMKRLRRLQTDARFARDYYARSKSRKRLEGMAHAVDPVQELYRALIEFLADKFNVTAAGMTSRDARQLLESKAVAPELIEGVDKILRACERDAYAAGKLNREEISALAHAAVSSMDRIEHWTRKGGSR